MSGLSNANGFSVTRTTTYTELQVAALNVASGLSIGSGTLVRNGVVTKMVTGYAPNPATGATATNSFRLLGAGGFLNLNTVPGLTNDTATAAANALSTTLLLPIGAVVISATATNNGVNVAGATNYNIGYTTTGLGSSTVLWAIVTPASLNSGTVADGSQISTPAVAGKVPLVAPNFVTVENNAGPANTTGDLKVVIQYVQF